MFKKSSKTEKKGNLHKIGPSPEAASKFLSGKKDDGKKKKFSFGKDKD